MKRHGFAVEYWEEKQLSRHYPFSRPAAIYSYGEAELNPYTFTLGLLEKARASRVRIFENTKVTGRKREKDGSSLILTERGHRIRARNVIVAAGCEGP